MYEKMADIFSENNNRQRLRDIMECVKLPCIPYLGEWHVGRADPVAGRLAMRPVEASCMRGC